MQFNIDKNNIKKIELIPYARETCPHKYTEISKRRFR